MDMDLALGFQPDDIPHKRLRESSIPVVKFRKGSSGAKNASEAGGTGLAPTASGEAAPYEEVDLGTGAVTSTGGGVGPANYGAHASSPTIEMQKSIGANGETVDAQGNCEGEFTVEQAVEAIGFGRFQIQISALTGLAWMADATEMMLLSILAPELRCHWNLSRWQEALITTVVFIGMFISSTMWGKICDKFGRRKGLILCSIWLCYYGFLSSFSANYIWILLLRGLVGFGIGGVPQSITLYAEFLPSKARGMCVVFIEVFWAIGTVMEVLLALVVMPTLGWRYLLFFSAIPVLIFILSCHWLPESARYHVACGNQEKAHAILKQVALCNNKPMPLGKLKIEENLGERGTYRDLFKTKELAITSILLLFIWFANAFCYYGLVLVSTELFASGSPCAKGDLVKEGLECEAACKSLNREDYISLLWTTFAEFPGVVITFLIIELLGRKKTMAVEFLGYSLFTFLLFICSTRTLLTVFLFAARALISGAFQAAYVYTPEVYPTATRALGMGCCSAMARVGAIITPFVAQVLLGYTPGLAISIYGSIALLAAVACMLLPVETKGREMVTTAQKSTSHKKT